MARISLCFGLAQVLKRVICKNSTAVDSTTSWSVENMQASHTFEHAPR